MTPILALIATNASLVQSGPLAAQVSEDAADDMFLSAAIAGDALVIVSGDPHLLDVSGWAGVTVLTPRQFTNQYLQGR